MLTNTSRSQSCSIHLRRLYHSAPALVSAVSAVAMSGKYAFSKALKELRFHHCQTSDHSNAVR